MSTSSLLTYRSVSSDNGAMDIAPAEVVAGALAARLDACGRRRARVHDLDRLAAAGGAGTRGGGDADRAGGPTGAAHARRAAPRRARHDDPRRRRGRPRRPRSRAPSRPGPCASPASPPPSAGRSSQSSRGSRRSHPDVRLRVYEHEPAEAFALLAADDVDLALVYDYDLAPRRLRRRRFSRRRCGPRPGTSACRDAPDGPRVRRRRRALGVPALLADAVDRQLPQHRRRARRPHDRVAGRLRARIAHRADSLELVQDLIVAGLGVAPAARRPAARARRPPPSDFGGPRSRCAHTRSPAAVARTGRRSPWSPACSPRRRRDGC